MKMSVHKLLDLLNAEIEAWSDDALERGAPQQYVSVMLMQAGFRVAVKAGMKEDDMRAYASKLLSATMEKIDAGHFEARH